MEAVRQDDDRPFVTVEELRALMNEGVAQTNICSFCQVAVPNKMRCIVAHLSRTPGYGVRRCNGISVDGNVHQASLCFYGGFQTRERAENKQRRAADARAMEYLIGLMKELLKLFDRNYSDVEILRRAVTFMSTHLPLPARGRLSPLSEGNLHPPADAADASSSATISAPLRARHTHAEDDVASAANTDTDSGSDSHPSPGVDISTVERAAASTLVGLRTDAVSADREV